ncbi:Hypothetical predicted protein [Mytilus galloprovincialis]|uniref:Uncharacterized protein n=1 Tax=Mytilus galloprovincialis TaxID=29158 RepID=A0A8B6FI36_MYTGA|nr:Hypothetical predicted protein [Mytilus galloprovincialis]
MHKVVEHFKTSNFLSDLEQTLSDLPNNFNSLMKDRFDNISLLANEKEKCLKEIAYSKRNVIAHLDKLETQLKTEIENLHQELFQAIELMIKEFEVIKTNGARMQEETGVIEEYTSDFQLFIAFRVFDSTVNSLETDVQSLIKRDSARQISISFSPNVELAIETLLTSLGNVNVIIKESNLRLVSHREKQAQLLTIKTPCIDKMPCIDKKCV